MLSKNKRGFLYFARPKGERGPIKIGFSTMPQVRVGVLGYWSPVPLELMGAFSAQAFHEDLAHRKFASEHSHYEWFYWSLPLERFVQRLHDGEPVAALLKKGDFEGVHNPCRGNNPASNEKRSLMSRLAWAERKTGKRFEHPLRMRSGFMSASGEPLPESLRDEIEAFIADANHQARA